MANQEILNYLECKSIVVWGIGIEGVSTLNFLHKYFPNKEIFIFEENEEKILANTELLKKDHFKICHDLAKLNEFDLIFKSPGIPLEKEWGIDLKLLTSQTDLMMQFYGQQLICITGTKGKSTTSSLLYHLLKRNDQNVILVGNIGIPCFDMIDQINQFTKIIFEISCHQLEFVTASPHIAVILNLFEDHLDHYKSFKLYKAAKENIFKFQLETDYFITQDIYPDQINNSKNPIVISKSNRKADLLIDNNKIVYGNEILEIKTGDTSLIGAHNLYNIAIAYYICHAILNISNTEFKKGLKTFKGLPHRIQFVGEYNQILFYDDSISTTGQSTIEAIKALEQVSTLLIGGLDRGIDYQELISFLSTSLVENVILLPGTADRLKILINKQQTFSPKVFTVSDLREAVQLSKQITLKKQICLLSPAAASYGYFKNFEDRGDHFQKYISE